MKRYRTNGRHIRELRERCERRATQKEFAYEVRISESQLHEVENRNAAVPMDVAQRIAQATQNAVKGPLALTRSVRANLMHRRSIDRLIDPPPPMIANKKQCSLVYT